MLDLGTNLVGTLLLELLVALLELQVVVELLDNSLLGVVLLAVVLLEDLALLRGGNLKSLVDEPRALVVLDVSADLTNVLGQTKVVEVVVLDLEVLAKRDEDILGLLEVLGSGEVELVQGQSNGEVERVVGSLVDDDELVLGHGEVVQVDLVLGGSEQIAQLSQLGLPGGLVEELNEVDVGGVGAEELLEKGIDGGLEDKGVVNGDHANTLLAVPAGLATAGDAAVHDVVRHQEESLEQLSHPSQGSGAEVLLFGEGLAEEGRDGVGDRHSAVAFATQRVDFEVLEY